MASNDYHFVTRWRVSATPAEVMDIIANPTDLPRWWPAVYIEAQELERGDERGVGKVIDLYTKGFLPYTLRWQFRVTESNYPHAIALEAWGDFVGRGIWTFEPDGDDVIVTYDWKIRADKPLLRYFSFLMKPFFSANHRWAMRQGLESLRLELVRRRATSTLDRALIPAPPARTTTSPVPLALGTLLSLVSALFMVRQLLRMRG